MNYLVDTPIHSPNHGASAALRPLARSTCSTTD
jgi:hypothetical protein